jgi:hypothetical protein
MNRRRLVAALAVLGLAPRMAKADTGWIVDEIYGAAARYGVSGDTLYNLAVCESNLDPGAVSHKLNQNGYHDLGLFQINPMTWDWWCGETSGRWPISARWRRGRSPTGTSATGSVRGAGDGALDLVPDGGRGVRPDDLGVEGLGG